jgi:hypothetical protein
MCEVLPTIDEASPSPDGENSRLEQLMISMLEEREKLMDKLHETQEAFQSSSLRLSQVETDNAILLRQLQALLPCEEDQEKIHIMLEEIKSNGSLTNGHLEEIQKWPIAAEIATLARDLVAAKQTIINKEEEVQELKAERSNMKLLLEHLECLVSRHEKSLRVTVLKRQTANTGGVSSEVEVLKALKSLFDHHKALDEKVRERLRSANEKNAILDEELLLANQEIKTLQDEMRRMKRLIAQRNSFRMSANYDNVGFTQEQLNLLQEKDQAISDLQFSLDEKTTDLEEAMQIREELTERVQDAEDELEAALRDLHNTKSELTKYQQSLSQEEALRVQLCECQEELTQVQSENQQLVHRLSVVEAQLLQQQQEVQNLQYELKQKHVSMEEVSQEQLRKQSLQLSESEQRRSLSEEKIAELEAAIEQKELELSSLSEKERTNEDHIERLQKMLKESNQMLKFNMAEKKALMDEKNGLTEQVSSLSSELATSQKDIASLHQQIAKLRRELQAARQTVEEIQSNSVVLRTAKVTDLDEAKWRKATVSDVPSVEVDVVMENESKETDWDFSEPGAVSRLMSMLEGQVSLLDQELEQMEDTDESFSQMATTPSGRISARSDESAPPPGSPPPPSPMRVKLRPKPSDTSRSKTSPLSKSTAKNLGSSVKKVFKRKSSSGSSLNSKQKQDKRNSAPAGILEGEVLPIDINEPVRTSIDLSDVSALMEFSQHDIDYKINMVQSAITNGHPFTKWKKDLVIAWLEVWVCVPQWYVTALKQSVDSGSLMESLTEVELCQMLGITNPMHRLKLKLAIQEIMSLTSKLPQSVPFYGDMDHVWISEYWLPSLGLPQYSDMFRVCLIDARMLEHLTKKDLRMILKVLDSTHRNSLQYGISVLKKLDYSRQELEKRRSLDNTHKDVLVWTNENVIKWVDSIGLKEYSSHLVESGIHGGIFALDYDFDVDNLAMALQIPPTHQEIRRQLKLEFASLLSDGTERVSSETQVHGRIVRKISKKLKMGSRKLPSNEFVQLRSTSPVLLPINQSPTHLSSSPSPNSLQEDFETIEMTV